MAISRVAGGIVGQLGGTATFSVTTQSGDVILFAGSTFSFSSGPSTPASGWTLKATAPSGSGSHPTQTELYYRVCDGTETSIAWSVGGYNSACFEQYRGCDSTVFCGSATAGSSASSTSQASGTFTPSADGIAVHFFLGESDNSGGGTVTAPTSTTQRDNLSASGNYVFGVSAEESITSGVTTTARTASNTDPGTWSVVTVGLFPAAAAAPYRRPAIRTRTQAVTRAAVI